MRWTLTVAALMAVLVAAGPASAAGRASCGPRDAFTVKSNRQLRVYDTVGPGAGVTYYVCARGRGGKAIQLSDAPFTSSSNMALLLLRGRYLVYVKTYCSDSGACPDDVGWVDVRNGVQNRAREARAGVDTVVATRAGAAAFLATADDGRERYIEKIDSLGVTELDRG